MAWAYHGRGTVRVNVGDYSRAIRDFTTALELDPSIAQAYFNRGLAYLVQGEEEKAQKDFEQCLILKPELKDDLNHHIELARNLRRIGK
jgi:tetratricopeptide (TPR) repeat protein